MRKHFLDIALLICVALPVMADLIGHLSSDARSQPGMTERVTAGHDVASQFRFS